MALTEISCKNLKPKDKIYSKSDGNGLILEIHPNDNKYWRFRYRFANKQKTLALGVYPEISLKEAREKRDEARKHIRNGEDPSELRKKTKIEEKEVVKNTFKNITIEYIDSRRSIFSEDHANKLIRRFELNIFPDLGDLPIKNIGRNDLICVLKKIEDRGAIDIASRLLQKIKRIFDYAINTERLEYNIADSLKGTLKPVKTKNYSHFSEKEFKEFLQNYHNFKGEHITKLALMLLMLTFVRSGELRGARWDEFDFEKKEWRVPAERMKMKRQHIVPLSKESIYIIEEIRKLTGDCVLLFPSVKNKAKPISDNTLSKALRDQGYQGKATPHGMRSTASTILNENGFGSDAIERQLAHIEQNKIRGAYNHAEYLPERRKMMDWWGEYIKKHSKGVFNE